MLIQKVWNKAEVYVVVKLRVTQFMGYKRRGEAETFMSHKLGHEEFNLLVPQTDRYWPISLQKKCSLIQRVLLKCDLFVGLVYVK